jgi:tetratricopeptide (TPR) repeat protein
LAHRSMAWLHEIQGNHEESMKWARRALELAPFDLETLVLISLLQMDTRKYTAALSTLQRAVELGPDYGRAYYQMATVYLKIGALDQALENYLLAGKYQGDPNALIQAGYVHLVKQQLPPAREKLLTSIEMKYLPFVAYYFLGYVEARAGAPTTANEYYRESIREGILIEAQEAGNVHVLGYRALALAGLGSAEESRSLLEEMAIRTDLDGENLYCVARGYAILNDALKALHYCQLAIQAHAGPTVTELRIDPHFNALAIELTDNQSPSS